MSSPNITNLSENERIHVIKELCCDKTDPFWEEKSDVFDFYNENFEFLLEIIQKQENKINEFKTHINNFYNMMKG
jgi:hypothetical protein